MFITSHETQFSNTGLSEAQAKLFQDGAVELYYDGSKKFETTSSGISVAGTVASDGLAVGDNEKATFGAAEDLEIYHDGVNSSIQNNTGVLQLFGGSNQIRLKPQNDEESIICNPNGNVELFFDNGKKFETTSDGTTFSGSALFPNNQRIKVGGDASNPDLQIWHNGTNNFFNLAGTSGLYIQHDTATKQYFTPTKFVVQDGVIIQCGNINDLQIQHDGSNNYIDSYTGALNIRSIGSAANVQIIADSEYMARFVNDGTAELYYDGSKKLETTSAGIDVTGRVTTDDLTVENTGGNLSAMFTATNGLGTLEVGGSTGAFIDLKHPATDDYDLRIGANVNNGYINTVNNFTITTNGENSIYAAADGATELYFDGSKKIRNYKHRSCNFRWIRL
jgi:hypothetical protein